MKKKFTRIAFAVACLCVASFGVKRISAVDIKVIYGEDDRKDFYQLKDDAALFISQGTVALVSEGNLKRNFNGTYRILTQPYSTCGFQILCPWCPEEPFAHQPTAAFCSGFLVAPDVIATAGHCVWDQYECEEVGFVFGFQMRSADRAVKTVGADDVYFCREGDGLIARVFDMSGEDYALIRLDRPVVGREPLRVRETDDISVGTPLGVAGHPAGLPQKVAQNATVRSVSDAYFTANLDTYGGNSGSPVFNTNDYVVEGVLVRGELDYVSRPGACNMQCWVSNECPNTGCTGEDATKTSVFAHLIPSESP